MILEKGEILIAKNLTKDEPSLPVVDRHGRPKWIISRYCWCSSTAETDCRFHSPSEPGWATCPSKPHPDASLAGARSLWMVNPEFEKPLPKPEESSGTDEPGS